ncbi:hypothetical protein QZH41_004248 [Actinostola sp. cb2023]|nr:hypothetical protein QZH41_004248 [Actinostola sp. cb2023]
MVDTQTYTAHGLPDKLIKAANNGEYVDFADILTANMAPQMTSLPSDIGIFETTTGETVNILKPRHYLMVKRDEREVGKNRDVQPQDQIVDNIFQGKQHVNRCTQGNLRFDDYGLRLRILRREDWIESFCACLNSLITVVKFCYDTNYGIRIYFTGLEIGRTVPSTNPKQLIGLNFSTRSTVSAKARAMAKKAALEAKAASLKSLHALQTEELEIHQKRAELELQTEISAAEAEKRVYEQAEAEETAEFAHLPNVNFSSTPLERQTTGNPVTEPVPTHSENQPAFSAPLPPNQTPLSSKPKTTLNPRTTAWHYEATPINQSSTLQEELVTRLMENQDRQSHALQQLVQQQQQSVTALTLPQPSLQVFNGDPVEYSDFVRAFEQLIEMKTQSPSTRLYYLVQYTTGHVQESMRSCLSMREEEGYLEAKRLLKERFGQGYRIAAR